MNVPVTRRVAPFLTLVLTVLAGAVLAPPAEVAAQQVDSGVSAVVSEPLGAAQRAGRRPNIVVLIVDDMRADDLRFMPHTRRLLGGQGVQFTNALSPNPLCCPARASTLTGRYTHNHGVFHVFDPYGFHAFDDRSTLATWLTSVGYATTYIGKYLNGYGFMAPPRKARGNSLRYVPPGWSDWRASIDSGLPKGHPKRGSSYSYFDTTLSANGRGFTNYHGRYQTQVYGGLIEQTIKARAPRKAPFYLHVSFTAPHAGGPRESDDPRVQQRADGTEYQMGSPARPTTVHGMFDDLVTEFPGADWVDPDISDKPEYLRTKPLLTDAERAGVLELTRQRAESLWVVDKQVRRTVAALKRSGELDDTVVMFTSDNGFYLGEHRFSYGKVFPHEPSLRVPLLVRGPGIPAGEVRHDPFTSIDIAPTLAAAARVRPRGRIDGVSLWDVVRRGDQGWTRAVLTESAPYRGLVRDTDQAGDALEPGEKPDVRFALGVRTSRWLYVDLATGERELYDVVADPEQYHNLAGLPAYESTQSRLAELVDRLRDCDGAACDVRVPPDLDQAP